jgi:hypothetical protein
MIDAEDAGSVFLLNVAIHLQVRMALQQYHRQY